MATRKQKPEAKKETTTDDFDFDPQGNPDDLPDTSGPIPEGWHKFHITRARLTTSSAGNPMIAFRYSLIGKDSDFEGRSVRDWITLTKTKYGFGKLMSLCQALDPDMVSVSKDPENGFDPRSQDSIDHLLLDQIFAAKIVHVDREYEDKKGKTQISKQENVEAVRGLTDEEFAQLEEDYGARPCPDLPDDAREDWPKKGEGGGGGGRSRMDDKLPF